MFNTTTEKIYWSRQKKRWLKRDGLLALARKHSLINQSLTHWGGVSMVGEGIYGREEANRNNVNSPYHRYPPYHSKIKNTRR